MTAKKARLWQEQHEIQVKKALAEQHEYDIALARERQHRRQCVQYIFSLHFQIFVKVVNCLIIRKRFQTFVVIRCIYRYFLDLFGKEEEDGDEKKSEANVQHSLQQQQQKLQQEQQLKAQQRQQLAQQQLAQKVATVIDTTVKPSAKKELLDSLSPSSVATQSMSQLALNSPANAHKNVKKEHQPKQELMLNKVQ